MADPPSVTIAIPTYSRSGAVSSRVDELLRLDPSLPLRFLIVDNASPDSTADKLRRDYSDPRLTISRNDENVGYAGNLLRIIELVETDYVLFVSDEDRIEPAGLIELVGFCEDQRPRLISPRAQVATNETYRGRHDTRPIGPSEFEAASFYISGLTMSVAFARAHQSAIADLIPDNAAASTYPQVLLTALAVAEGNSWFLESLVSVQVESHPTHIADRTGGAYFGVIGRWSQFQGYEDFFGDRIDGTSNDAHRQAFSAMRTRLREQILNRLTIAAQTEVPSVKPNDALPAARRTFRQRVGALLGR